MSYEFVCANELIFTPENSHKMLSYDNLIVPLYRNAVSKVLMYTFDYELIL